MKIKIWIFMSILTIILSSGFFSVATYFMANLSKIANYKTKQIFILVSIIISSSIIGFCFYFINYYLIIKVKTLFRENIKIRITNKILSLSYEEIEEINSASFISWYSNDLDILTKDRYGAIFEIFNFATLLVANLITMFLFSPWLSLFGFISILLLLIVLLVSSKLLNKINIIISNNNQSYTTNLIDTISGYSIFYSSNKVDEYEKLIHKHSNRKMRDEQKADTQKNGIEFFTSFFKTAVIIGMFLIVVLLYKLNYVEIGVLLSISLIAIPFSTNVSGIFDNIQNYKSSKELYLKFKMKNQEWIETINSQKIKSLEFKNISIERNEITILDNFSFVFEQNKKYLITGKSGVGKSTLLNSFIGLTPIKSGEIILNNNQIEKENLINLRADIEYIEQETYLFDDSIAYNITLSDNYDKTKLEKIIKKVKLDYLIENSSEGLETQIGGISQKISGGEKQRIALARALYSDKRFLLLDESTANLDPDTKNEIEKLVLTDEQLTVIMVSHDFTSENLKLIDKKVELSGVKK